MLDSGAGAHPLHVAGPDDRAVAQVVLVLQGAFDHVGQDFHVTMGMGAEALAGVDDILVDHAQDTETHMVRVVVAAEGKTVSGVQPAVVHVAAVF